MGQVLEKMILLLRYFGEQAVGNFIRLAFRGKTVILVCGMRRSGNHAFVNWLSNAIEEKETTYCEDREFYHFCVSDSGKTVFLNEVNFATIECYIKMLIRKWGSIRRCQTVIISGEDVAESFCRDVRVPRATYRIYVWRSLLNVIASRLHNLKKKAAVGIGWSRQSIDDKFFETLKSWNVPGTGVIRWEYDRWICDASYRKRFLKQLNLECDILPPISKHGGGSSFNGQMKAPDSKEATNRFKNVTIPENIFQKLREEAFCKMLLPEEITFLDLERSRE